MYSLNHYSAQPRSNPWWKQFHYWAIVLFSLILPFATGKFGVLPLLTLILCGIALLMQTKNTTAIPKGRKPIELVLYTLWGVWAITCGAFLWISFGSYIDSAKMLIRTLILIWAFFCIFVHQKKLNYFYALIIFVALLQVAATQLGVKLESNSVGVGSKIVQETVDFSQFRAEGLTGNANAMGFFMMSGSWACIMLWGNLRGAYSRYIIKFILLMLIVLFGYYTIQTASRKSLLTMGLILSAWLVWIIPGKFSIKSILMVFMFAAIVMIFSGVFMAYLDDTVMGHRFQQWFDAGGGSATEGFKENIRYWLYVDGFNFWRQHPIAGIGFGQFPAYHWSGLYSHSDYMEPLACTGLVGFILYQGFAVSILLRLVKLLQVHLAADDSYTVKGMILFLIGNHFIVGIGAPFWNDAFHLMIIVFMGTYSWRLKNFNLKGRFLDLT